MVIYSLLRDQPGYFIEEAIKDILFFLLMVEGSQILFFFELCF